MARFVKVKLDAVIQPLEEKTGAPVGEVDSSEKNCVPGGSRPGDQTAVVPEEFVSAYGSGIGGAASVAVLGIKLSGDETRVIGFKAFPKTK